MCTLIWCFGSQSVTNLTTSRLKNRPAKLLKTAKQGSYRDQLENGEWSVPVTACLPQQSIALTRSASVPFKNRRQNHLHIITINSIRGRTKPLFYRTSVLTYKFDSHGERTKTTVLPKQQSIVLTKSASVR